MKPPEIFGVVVRVAGLYLFFFAGWYLVYALSVLVGVEKASDSAEMRAYFFDGAIYILIALYFLRGAPHLMRFCYPKARDDTSKDAA